MQPKDQITNPRARVLEAQAPLNLLLELSDHLPHNIRLEILRGRAPKHGLRSERHHNPECGKLHGHLGMTGDSNPQPLRQGAHFGGTDYGQPQLGPLICRRVCSSICATHCLLASFYHRSASAALSAKPESFASSMT
jgi:hypothetical protein